MNNVEEVQESPILGLRTTNPMNADTDNDGMPDGWEHMSGIHPNDEASNADEDPDFDGYDADGDGGVRYSELVGITTVHAISVEISDYVQVNNTVLWSQDSPGNMPVCEYPYPDGAAGWLCH